MNIENEIERSRKYLHDLIDERFKFHLQWCYYTDVYPDRRGIINPKFYDLYRFTSRDHYETYPWPLKSQEAINLLKIASCPSG